MMSRYTSFYKKNKIIQPNTQLKLSYILFKGSVKSLINEIFPELFKNAVNETILESKIILTKDCNKKWID
jgi:hypothetical protein